MYLRLFVVPNKFLSVCLPTFFLSLKKHVRRCGDKPIYIGAVLEDGGKENELCTCICLCSFYQFDRVVLCVNDHRQHSRNPLSEQT